MTFAPAPVWRKVALLGTAVGIQIQDSDFVLPGLDKPQIPIPIGGVVGHEICAFRSFGVFQRQMRIL